jgi:hypothetical protein
MHIREPGGESTGPTREYAMPLLEAIENSAFAIWLRESPSLFAYTGVLSLHTIGLGFLVGISTGIALRMLGFTPELPLAPLGRFFPLMWAGFFVNAFSGVMLLICGATTVGPLGRHDAVCPTHR